MTSARVAMDDGVQLWAELAGPADAPAVLFCHSVGCGAALWDSQFEALRDELRVIRYDARGHGRSDAPDGDYALERIARDAVAIMDWADAPEVHLCGLSLGGTTALKLGLEAPQRLRSMVLANSSARLGSPEGWRSRMDAARERGMEALADFSMTRFFSDRFAAAEPEVVARFRAAFAATSAQGYAGCCAVLRDADFTADLGRIGVATLVVGGTEDRPTPLADSEVLAERIAGAELCVLPTGHLSNVEAAGAFTARLRSWISQT